jgi:hypothetical protein
MANLIIKSSADNLVLQGSDASPAITVAAAGTTTFAENATLSGNCNIGGVLNHDAQKYSWRGFFNTVVDYSSVTDFDFQGQTHVGSGISESGGTYTIGSGGAGTYIITAGLTMFGGHATPDIDANLFQNGSSVTGTRFYLDHIGGSTINYVRVSGTFVILAADSDTFKIRGTGHVYGDANVSMTFFCGIRIGAKT